MHVHVCSGTAERMGLGRPAALLLPEKKDQNKQEQRRAAAGTAGLDADAWRGVDEAAAPRPGHRL